MPADRDTLLVDIGNTRLKWCALDDADGSAEGVQAIAHDAGDADKAWQACLQARAWRSIRIASVAPPPVVARFEQSCAKWVPDAARTHARTHAECGDLRIGYDQPAQLGVDRFLALLAARRIWPRARVLLASIGSAFTIDLLEADGAHAGGLIAPSPNAMHRSLVNLAPQLASASPALDQSSPTVFARDTAGGIASGCTFAAIGLIEHCERAATVRGNPPMLVLAGGGAAALVQHLRAGATLMPYLVLAGLRRYAQLGLPDPGPDA